MSSSLVDRPATTVPAQTIASRFLANVQERSDRVALRWRDPDGWKDLTWHEYGERACRVAAGLRQLGVERGERVVLMMRNRPEFHVADVAALLIGGIPVSFYNSSSPEQVQYLTAHCGASVAIVEDVAFLERFLKVRDELPDLRHLVVIDDPEQMAPPDVVPFSRLLQSSPIDLADAAAAVRPEDIATLIYTSGTTGPPKGVVITFANVSAAIDSLLERLDRDVTGWRMISFLPMAHIAERLATHYINLSQATQVSTCPNPVLIADYLRDVHPELFFAVPRVWEKAHATIAALAAADPAQKAEFDRALEVGARVAECRATSEALTPELEEAWSQAEAVLGFVRALIGLDECKLAVTAAAPIPVDVLRFFRALGVPLSELYGMSETTGPLTWEPYEVRPGDVGRAIPGCEVKTLDDGEVIGRGANIFPRYYNDPERTAETLDDEGWLHTGDLGRLDTDGRLTIVGRKKDLIITAGGENISPSNIENMLRAYPLVGQVCVVGDRRPYLAALVTLDGESAVSFARGRGIDSAALQDLTEHPDVRAEIQQYVDEVNARLSRIEQLKRFSIMAREWAPDSDELTPTMKLKRGEVLAKYAAEVDALYR